jgi:two-component system LytT family response regulator
MKRIRTVIADDERLGREGIAALLRTDSEIEVIGACADGKEALELIQAERPDLAFLDVEMPVLTGLEVLQQLPAAHWPVAIFVTAYDHYALRAFDISAVDYLVKPFREARFLEAVAKAKALILRRSLGDLERQLGALFGQLQSARLTFKVGRSHLIFSTADIVWIEADRDGVKLCENGQVHFVRESLQAVEQRLNPDQFTRVHRSFLINTARVRKISSLLYGEHELLMSDGVKIRLGRAFREKLKILLPGVSNR